MDLGVCASIPSLASFFSQIDDCHGDRIHSSLTIDNNDYFNNDGYVTYVGKNQVAWKENLSEKLQENLARCTGH